MRVVVAGGTGLIGRALVATLRDDGHEVAVLTRGPGHGLPPGVRAVRWTARPAPSETVEARDAAGVTTGGRTEADWCDILAGADAVVNLAGASLAAGRWTAARKRQIRESRVQATRALVQAMAGLRRPPAVLVSASATGWYGDPGERVVDEEAPPGTGFLAEVCRAWEAEALRAEALGVRVVLLRTGLVLAREGGALPRIALPFRLGLGGPLGSGRQWWSWIHLADEVGLIRFLLAHPQARGPVNAVAPEPVTNEAFARTLARVLRRPCRLRAPAWALRLALGAMADELLLAGQRVRPARVLALGYRFARPTLEPALRDLLLGA